MIDRLPRFDPGLSDAIEQLDAKYQECGKDAAKAWASLSDEELRFIVSEVNKCLKDPRYYIHNYHFIRSKRSVVQPLYPLWDSQVMFLDICLKQFKMGEPIRVVVLKARQLGITSISVAMLCWLVFFHPNTQSLSMSDDDSKVEVNFNMSRTAWENLPWWMQPSKRYDVKGSMLGFDRAKAEDRAKNPGMGSLLWFESANQPSGAAYSKSLLGAHLAEVARYRDSKPITEGIFGSLVNYHGSIGVMESTAQGRHNVWHRICKNSQAGKLGWKFMFLQWFTEPGYSVAVPANFEATQDEIALRDKIKIEAKVALTDGQLQWRRDKMAEFEATDGDAEVFHQEFPISPAEAFIASGRCAFSKKRLQDMITNFCRPPKWEGNIRLAEDDHTPKLSHSKGGPFQIWEFSQKKVKYYVSGDPSLGIEGGDAACVQVYSVPEDINQPLRQVARWHGWIAPGAFARIMVAIGYFYNEAELAPEANTISTVASDIVKVLNYPSFYIWMREDKIRNAYSSFIGWWTTFKNKNEMIGRFREALDEWTVIIRSEEDIDEFFDFVEDESGGEKFRAREGASDDCVMAHLIAYYCCTQLRPRKGGEFDDKPAPKGQDWINTDYSLFYDKDNPDYGQDSDLPKYDEL